jgi:hypothetical protein
VQIMLDIVIFFSRPSFHILIVYFLRPSLRLHNESNQSETTVGIPSISSID